MMSEYVLTLIILDRPVPMGIVWILFLSCVLIQSDDCIAYDTTIPVLLHLKFSELMDSLLVYDNSSFFTDSSEILVNKIERGFTCFGMFSNVVLLPMIMFRSPSDIGVYKFLMMYISVFEIFFGWLELMIVPDLYTEGSAFIVTVDPDNAVLPDSALQISLLIYCGSFATSLALFGVQFAYRFQVLNGNVEWTSHKIKNFVVWCGVPLIVAALWILSCWFFLGRNEYVDAFTSQDSYPYHLENKTIGFVGIYFYPNLQDGTTVINTDSFVGMALCSCLLFGSESLMLFYALKSYLITKSLMTSAHSSTFRKLQWQLFYALASQTVIPILFMQVPMSLIYLTLFLNISTPFFGRLQAFTISLYLATDALPTIFIIKPYRETVLGYFKCCQSVFRKDPPVTLHGMDSVISMNEITSRYAVSSY